MTVSALAQQPAVLQPLPSDAHVDVALQPPEGKTSPEALERISPDAVERSEAPPARPRHKGVVLDSTLGVLGFLGQFRHVAPPAYWLHTQVGYEVLSWLALFVEAELAFTDTSESQDASHTRGVPIWGFGGGARVTFHPTTRLAPFVQGEVGALEANVAHDELAVLGFRNAESLGAAFGARVGVEWYQIDRHLALCAQIGARDAPGFAKFNGKGDTPLLWDIGGGLGYTF
jgi:hypothetical protein